MATGSCRRNFSWRSRLPISTWSGAARPGTPILGGMENNTEGDGELPADGPLPNVHATAIAGGVDIKTTPTERRAPRWNGAPTSPSGPRGAPQGLLSEA
jgi:hypothetical protein